MGLAGRNIRLALEIFLDFCTSGHIGEDQIFQIKHKNGDYRLPKHVISNVLLRRDRKYYDGDYSHIKNIYQNVREASRIGHFAKYFIINWLKYYYQSQGPSGLKGFHRVADLYRFMNILGYPEEDTHKELLYLLESDCIVAEHMQNAVSSEDLISITPTGFHHLVYSHDLNYLVACAEDTYLNDHYVAENITEKLANSKDSLHKTVLIAEIYLEYLKREHYKILNSSMEIFQWRSEYEKITDFNNTYERAHDRISYHKDMNPWYGIDNRYPIGEKVYGKTINITRYGIFVRIEDHIDGLIPTSHLKTIKSSLIPSKGQELELEVHERNELEKRLILSIPHMD